MEFVICACVIAGYLIGRPVARAIVQIIGA
jgi:hypothetical protein